MTLDTVNEKIAAVRAHIGTTIGSTGPLPSDPKLAAVADALEAIAEELRTLRES